MTSQTIEVKADFPKTISVKERIEKYNALVEVAAFIKKFQDANIDLFKPMDLSKVLKR